MPVVPRREAWPQWLGEGSTRKDDLQLLLNPFPAERMRAYPISTKVNRVNRRALADHRSRRPRRPARGGADQALGK
jgi:putative SOS response-associated peptidase YedK